eukprot:Opistho-2@70557
MDVAELPQKRFYRQRAHVNPHNDHSFEYPIMPSEMDWSTLFPAHFTPRKADGGEGEEPSAKKQRVDAADVSSGAVVPSQKEVEIADIGCGFGGFLVELGSLFPDTLCLGMEIRMKVSDYVRDRIIALRERHPGDYQNIAVMRTNAMKYMPNLFRKAQLKKIFFLFPDPHFKKTKHKWRIVSSELLCEYAYCLTVGGLLYTITDVRDLHEWMVSHIQSHPLFERVSDADLEGDIAVPKMFGSSEEAQKVTRNNGEKLLAVFRRVADNTD